MNYDIKCSKCQLLADTHMQSLYMVVFRMLSMAFSGNAEQINQSAF